jgi:8-oxo-dGTP pyrophosphatase MutT (NUDIX family)
MTSSAEPEPRPAARVLLLDGRDRVLLFPWRLLSGQLIWITPGGGLDAGETHEQAAIRELREETGLQDFELGPCVWKRDHVFPWDGRLIHQLERFFLVRVEAADIDTSRHEAHEVAALGPGRWWSLEEIAGSQEEFAPRRLATFLEPLLAGQLPAEPIDTGV